MRLINPVAFGLTALVLLSACAGEPVWTKQDGNMANFEQDTAACFRSASQQARAQALTARRGAAPQIELRTSQGRIHDSAGTSRTAASLEENAERSRLYSQCMHRLGYRRTKP